MSTCNRDQILKDHRLKLFWLILLIYLLRAEFVSYVLNGEKSGAAGLSITGAVWHDIICGMKLLVSFFHHHLQSGTTSSHTPGLSMPPGVAGGIWSRCWYSSCESLFL